MENKTYSLIEMAKILNLPHNSFLSEASAIYDKAIEAGYVYKEWGFVKVK